MSDARKPVSPRPISPIKLHHELKAIWDTPPGWGRLSAINHTVLGKRFIVAAFVFFAIGGVLAMLIRAQLASPRSPFVGPDVYNQLFTMHGTVMMFLFAIPMFEGFAIYLLPKMLGARDMAFPRLTAYGFWCYVFGGSILIAALILGVAPDSGWFLYTPLSSSAYTPGINADIWLIGITFVEISALSAAIEITVSILKMRAPGMSLDKMPIMAWYLLVTALMMLFGFPPLILGSILLELERAFDLPFFDPTRGGDSLLWQHLFWLFGHPEVYIIFLPAAGAISMMIPTFARYPLVGYKSIIAAIVAVGFLSFGLWVHHMFAVGIPHLALAFFSAASGLVAIPTGLQIFAWIATLARGRPRLDVPMLYLAGFFVIFVIGGLTGVMLAMVPFDLQAHDTHFVVAHLHYVLVGGFVFPMMAGAYYWLPHVTGRISDHKLSVPAFWLIFGGFNLTFFIMHLTGLLGMPRRIDSYPPEAKWEWLNLVSSIGSFIMTIGFALFVVDIILQVRFGKAFRRNPWQAKSLEWATPTPPPSYAFGSLPHIEGQGDWLDAETQGRKLAGGEGYLGFTRNGWQETLGVQMTEGTVDQVIILPRTTFLPLWTGLATGAIVLCLLFKFYWLALVPFAVTVALLLGWTRSTGMKSDLGPLPIGRGQQALLHWEAAHPPSWWALVFALCANGTFLAALLFGCVFLATIAPGWPPVVVVSPSYGLLLLAGIMLLAAALYSRWALRETRADRSAKAWLGLAALSQLATIAALVVAIANAIPDPTLHAHQATLFAVLGYVVLHAGVGTLFALYAWQRCRSGKVSARRSLDLRLNSLWQDYTACAGLLCLLAVPVLIWLTGEGAMR